MWRVYQSLFTNKQLCSCAKFDTTSVAHFSPIIAFNLQLMVYIFHLFLADLSFIMYHFWRNCVYRHIGFLASVISVLKRYRSIAAGGTSTASEAGAVEQLRYQEVLVWSPCPSWEVAWPRLQGRRNQQHTLYKDLPWQYNEALWLQCQALSEK